MPPCLPPTDFINLQSAVSLKHIGGDNGSDSPTQIEQIEQIDPPNSSSKTLPTMYDLPSEDPEESGLPDEFHDLQPQLLSRTLRLTNYSRDNCLFHSF